MTPAGLSRSLEAYFAVQPRPSGEKIAAIAEKLELKKNVVRVWFCNQRQKQKVLTIGKKIQAGVKLFAISFPFILFIMELLGEHLLLCSMLLREI